MLGAIGLSLSACRPQPGYELEDPQTGSITNNTYVAGRGYWHAPFYAWYPYPYNDYRPSLGYYYGGSFHDTPHSSPITASRPGSISGSRSSANSSHASSVSRGGFGSSGHSSAAS